MQPPSHRPAPRHRLGRRSPGRARRATGLAGLLLALLGTGVALLLTTAAPPPTSLPGVLEVAVHPRAGHAGTTSTAGPPATATTAPTTTTPATATPATASRPTTVPATTVPPTTVPATTVPATTAPATTVPATRPAAGDGQKPSGDQRSKGDGSTTVVAPSPSVRIEDNAGRRVGGDH